MENHLIIQIYYCQADSILSQIRKAFTPDINKFKVVDNIIDFPVNEIFSNIKKDITVGNEFIEELLYSQKDDKYTFSILSLLFPNLDYKMINLTAVGIIAPNASCGISGLVP